MDRDETFLISVLLGIFLLAMLIAGQELLDIIMFVLEAKV